MSRIDRTHGVRRAFAAAALAVAVVVMGATMSAEARSITGVERVASAGAISLNVTFEAGEPGDEHALYIAYDTEDKGADISNWAALQRGCVVADDATSATIPVSPLLTGTGYTFCRVFLTTSAAPYDTLIESVRSTGSQYINTGIKPDPTTIASLDFQFSDASTTQQRVFGVSSDSGKDYATFSFDAYINGSGYWASACQDGGGDFLASSQKASTDRLTITLDATTGDHTVSNHVSGVVTTTTRSTTRTATSAGTMPIFAHHKYYYESKKVKNDFRNIAKGGLIYGGTITTNGAPARIYHPCALGGRAGLYDAVSGQISYSAVATDFVTGSDPVACSLLAGETQLSAAPDAIGLIFDYTWRGTAANWDDADAWTKDGDPATWVAGNNAIFETANATATLSANVTANAVAFNADATIATNGTDEATLAVKSVSVDSGVAATISAPTAGALEKTGAGTLTLTQNRADATTLTEGTLKMNGATVAGLTLGTDGGAPVTFDYGGQELVKNAYGLDYLVTGSTVMLTNGIFSTASDYDLNIRDDTFTMPSVLTIAKDAVVRQGAIGKSVYIVNVNGTATINVIGGTLGNTNGCSSAYLQHKSPNGGLNLNVTEGGLVYFPCQVYALCRGDIADTSPSLYMTFSNSVFSVGNAFQFGSSYSKDSYVPTTPTGVFAATNSVISIATGFWVGRDASDAKSGGSFTVDFEDCIVTAKFFAVHHDRPLSSARFNDTRFVFNAASGYIAADNGEANWITVGADGLTIDTQTYSETLNANLGGSGAVTKVGAGTLTLARDQTSTAAFNVGEGTLALNAGLTVNRPIAVASGATLSVNAAGTASVANLALANGSTLNITSYNGTTPFSVGSLTLPESGSVTLTLNGGAFTKGVYAIYSKSGVTAEDGAKFAPSTGELGYSWSVEDGTLVLTVGEVSGNYWTGRAGDGRMSTAANWLNGVPAAGSDIDLSAISSATTIIADTGRAFGMVTMGDAMITFTNALTVAGFSDPLKVTVGADSTVTIDNDVTLDATPQRLCSTILTGGTLHITGSVEIESSSIIYALYSATSGGTIIVDDGIAVSGNGTVWWNARVLALGENGISFTGNAPFLFTVDDAEVYALGERTVLGTEGRGRFRSRYDDVFLCTTQYGSDRPATITFDGNFNGVKKENAGSSAVNFDCWGHWRATGCGRVVCTTAAQSNRGLRAYDEATLAFIPSTKTIGSSDQTFYVYNKDSGTAGGTLEVASSGTVTLTGDLSLADGTALAFNFTDWSTPPQLALASGKSVVFTEGESTNITVKVSGTVRPKGGEHQLTTCGGFGAEGVSVSLAAGTPKWVKGVSVNGDGNIVITVNPKGLMIIFK